MEKAADTSAFTITYFATRSFVDAFGAEISGDTTLLIVSISNSPPFHQSSGLQPAHTRSHGLLMFALVFRLGSFPL